MNMLGYRLIPARLAPTKAILRLPAALSVGISTTATVVWCLGVLGTSAAACLAGWAVALAGLTGACAWWRDVRLVALRVSLLLRSSIPLSLALAATTILLLPQLLLPVLSSDGLRYHLALPKLFLLENQIFFYHWDVHAAMPQAAEMLYLLMLPLGGGEAAKYLHSMFFVCCLILLILFVHRDRMSRRGSLAAALAFAATPAAIAAAGAAFIDHFVLFHLAAACVLTRNRSHPGLIGWVIGGALACKWTAGPAVAGVLVLVLCSRGRQGWLRRSLQLGLPVLLLMTPLMIRNSLATGDPFFPTGTALLTDQVPGVSAERFAYVTQVHSHIPGPLGIPWDAAVSSVQPDEVVGWHHLAGMVLLPLLLGRRFLWPAAALILPYLVVGLYYHPSVRLVLPMFWGLAAYQGWFVGRLPLLGRLLAALLLIPALIGSGTLMLTTFNPRHLWTGSSDRRVFQPEGSDYFDAADFVNAQPAGGRVMALAFPVPFLFDRPWIAEGLVNEPPLGLWFRAGCDADCLLGSLQSHQVRWLVVPPDYGGGNDRTSLAMLADNPQAALPLYRLRQKLHLIRRFGSIDIYLVPAPGKPARCGTAEPAPGRSAERPAPPG